MLGNILISSIISHDHNKTLFAIRPPAHAIYVTSSAKRYLIGEQTVSSKISCFHTFLKVFFINTAQGAIKMFSLDAHE